MSTERVEVEQRRHDHDEDRGARVEDQPVGGDPGQRTAARLEQAVLVGHEADQEEAGHQDEGRPVLGRRREGVRGGRQHGRQEGGAAQSGQHHSSERVRAWA